MTADTCATPGCGHARDEHWTLNVGDHMDTRCCYPGCPCTAYLPPRPVPEEGCACGDPRPHGPHEFALQDATVPAPHADAEAAAKAAFEQWRAEQRHPVLYYDSVTFIAGYLRGRGDRG